MFVSKTSVLHWYHAAQKTKFSINSFLVQCYISYWNQSFDLHKMVEHTQTADEFFECVLPFCANQVTVSIWNTTLRWTGLRISSVNVIESAEVIFTGEVFNGKLHFLRYNKALLNALGSSSCFFLKKKQYLIDLVFIINSIIVVIRRDLIWSNIDLNYNRIFISLLSY